MAVYVRITHVSTPTGTPPFGASCIGERSSSIFFKEVLLNPDLLPVLIDAVHGNLFTGCSMWVFKIRVHVANFTVSNAIAVLH